MGNDKRAEMELPQIILASGSPRRADLLEAVGWKFRKIVADVDESEHQGEEPTAYVTRLAVEKSKAVAEIENEAIVLGADTTVVVDNSIVGKPVDVADATRMITLLSGRWHDVLTGVALTYEGRTMSGVQRTSVKFTAMSSEEIGFLVKFGDPLDKAGAYAIQAQAALFIEEIKGDYWNVTGLPVNLVYRLYRTLCGNET
ncbi:MAG: Maf family protein [Acidobacteriota bacterium]|nr:Maf family protein [Acidobacteriota bacterium]MDH3528698.1 Maf family protein [Acidobacteriota bacterium]